MHRSGRLLPWLEEILLVYIDDRDTEKADLLVPPKVESVAYEKRDYTYLSRCQMLSNRSATKGNGVHPDKKSRWKAPISISIWHQ